MSEDRDLDMLTARKMMEMRRRLKVSKAVPKSDREFVMERLVDRGGEVLLAGNFPKDSIFYVPSVPLPKNPVKVGDTWETNYSWRGLKNQVRLQMVVTSVFKALYECSDHNPCAEIEFSGEVSAPDIPSSELKLVNEIRGRILLHTPTGSTIWSEVRNKETIFSGKVRVDVVNCIEGLVEFPEIDRWVWRSQPKCEPNTIIPERLPGS